MLQFSSDDSYNFLFVGRCMLTNILIFSKTVDLKRNEIKFQKEMLK